MHGAKFMTMTKNSVTIAKQVCLMSLFQKEQRVILVLHTLKFSQWINFCVCKIACIYEIKTVKIKSGL